MSLSSFVASLQTLVLTQYPGIAVLDLKRERPKAAVRLSMFLTFQFPDTGHWFTTQHPEESDCRNADKSDIFHHWGFTDLIGTVVLQASR